MNPAPNLRWASCAVATLMIAIAAVNAVPGQDMDDRTPARGLAVIVNDALGRYIDTHNDVFKVSARRLVPIPGVFEGIDFRRHVDTLIGVENTLTKADVTTASVLQGSRDPAVRRFLEDLQKYRGALLEAVQQFRGISENLYRKSQTEGTYEWAMYQTDLDAYELAIKRYRELGTGLNAAYEGLK